MESPHMSDGSFQNGGGSPELPQNLKPGIEATDRDFIKDTMAEMFDSHESPGPREPSPLIAPDIIQPIFPEALNSGPRIAERRIARPPHLKKLIDFRHSDDREDEERHETLSKSRPHKSLFDWDYSDDDHEMYADGDYPEELDYPDSELVDAMYEEPLRPSEEEMYVAHAEQRTWDRIRAYVEAFRQPRYSADWEVSNQAAQTQESNSWISRVAGWRRAAQRTAQREVKPDSEVKDPHDVRVAARKNAREAQRLRVAKMVLQAQQGTPPVSKKQLLIDRSAESRKPVLPRLVAIEEGRGEWEIEAFDTRSAKSSEPEPDTSSQIAA